MKNKAILAIERHHMLRTGDTVLVALSGGADSMALLHVLHSLKDQYSITLSAAHFNHGIRGEEAKRDENFCKAVCEKMQIELFTDYMDIPKLAAEKGIGVEECGRNERYAFFERVAPNAKIATAHTLSDCEETFLFNLARGTSLKGLTSIPALRGNIIRPLIDCSRAEIESYCNENNIKYVTDSTNLSDEYTRNHLRLNIIPQLKKINPAFDVSFLRCVQSLREDEELLDALTLSVIERAKNAEGYRCDVLNGVHVSLRKRAAAKIIEEFSGEKPQTVHIDAVCDIVSAGGSTQVATGISLYVHAGILKKMPEAVGEWEQKMQPGINILPCEKVNIEFFDEKNKINIQKFNKHLLAKVIDYDKIKGALLFSSMREGDKIKPYGRGVTKALRRIFNEMRIEPALRRGVSVLRDDAGVVWVSGVGVDERVCADETTKRLYFIETLD